MNHLINRLQFEIQCPDEEQAFLLRHHVSSIVQDQLTSAVDEVCSAQTAEDEIIHIDRLEIDLGTFTMHSFHTDFASVFSDKFKRQLKEYASQPETKSASHFAISETELLFHFLLNGDLPWWANENEVDLNSVTQDLVFRQPTTFASFLYQQKKNINVWKRITWQLNSETKAAIFFLIKELVSSQEQFAEWSGLVIRSTTDKTAADVLLIQKHLSHDVLLVNAPLIFAYQEPKDLLSQLYINYLEEAFISDSIQKEVMISIFKKESGSLQNENPDTPSIRTLLEYQEQANFADTHVEAKERYILKNAGIVLLSPFFKPLFERLNLLHQKQWVDANAQYKAAHLLSFLATGSTNSPEYGLVLSKMLCGMLPTEPIPSAEPFSKQEIEEMESLLLSAIEHWKALKNTSINGFRETFLKRDGILTPSPNGWLVQVERKTVDVLLDSIPWGYTTITSSWNPNFIFVEW